MRRRNGFTLVELLVAMALIIFIMAILSQAFVSATTTFRNLKAAGDMANKLRAVTTLMQRDLAADHFEGKKRLSSPGFWNDGPPQQGFFRIVQPTNPLLNLEGADQDGIGSYRSVNQSIAFTVKLRGNDMSSFFQAGQNGGVLLGNQGSFGPREARYMPDINPPPPGLVQTTYNFQWAEVAWFLVAQTDASGQQETANDQNGSLAGTPLYTLYRRQRLAVPDNSLITPAVPYFQASQCLDLSGWQNGANIYFNSPTDLTVPDRRLGGAGAGIPPNPFGIPFGPYQPIPAGMPGAMTGSDIQLTDVISFDIRVLPGSPSATLADPFVSLYDLSNPFNLLYGPPFPPNRPRVFDTWSSVKDNNGDYSSWSEQMSPANQKVPNPVAIPMMGVNIKAIQITIRIWDAKTNQSRQVTIVQAM